MKKNLFAEKNIVLSRSDAEPPHHTYGVELVTLKEAGLLTLKEKGY